MAKLKTIRPVVDAVRTSTVRVEPKVADQHYQTKEHRQWARGVLQRAGYRCQHPGCTYTRHDGRLYADHIIELKDGGAPLDPANGQALCPSHHTSKTAAARTCR